MQPTNIARMHGPEILVRTLSVAVPMGTSRKKWQYHSRSDRHSKVACWGILFDLMQNCDLLRKHVEEGRVAFGINHEMRDFRMNRKKNLDLVVCTPRASGTGRKRSKTFASLVDDYAIVLSDSQEAVLDGLPELAIAPVGAVHIALEAKACMTAHGKAQPRLYDELNSSHLTIHGDTEMAIAVGFAMVNIAKRFRSPSMPVVSVHKQPDDTVGIVRKVMELPRRTNVRGDGFDAFAIVIVDCLNDGKTPVRLVSAAPAPKPGDIYNYDTMIQRLAALYEARFPRA